MTISSYYRFWSFQWASDFQEALALHHSQDPCHLAFLNGLSVHAAPSLLCCCPSTECPWFLNADLPPASPALRMVPRIEGVCLSESQKTLRSQPVCSLHEGVSLSSHVINCYRLFVSPQNFYVEGTIPNVIILEVNL